MTHWELWSSVCPTLERIYVSWTEFSKGNCFSQRSRFLEAYDLNMISNDQIYPKVRLINLDQWPRPWVQCFRHLGWWIHPACAHRQVLVHWHVASFHKICKMLLHFTVSLSVALSMWKIRSPVTMMFLSTVAKSDRNFGHSNSRKPFVVTGNPFCCDWSGLYTTRIE